MNGVNPFQGIDPSLGEWIKISSGVTSFSGNGTLKNSRIFLCALPQKGSSDILEGISNFVAAMFDSNLCQEAAVLVEGTKALQLIDFKQRAELQPMQNQMQGRKIVFQGWDDVEGEVKSDQTAQKSLSMHKTILKLMNAPGVIFCLSPKEYWTFTLENHPYLCVECAKPPQTKPALPESTPDDYTLLLRGADQFCDITGIVQAEHKLFEAELKLLLEQPWNTAKSPFSNSNLVSCALSAFQRKQITAHQIGTLMRFGSLAKADQLISFALFTGNKDADQAALTKLRELLKYAPLSNLMEAGLVAIFQEKNEWSIFTDEQWKLFVDQLSKLPKSEQQFLDTTKGPLFSFGIMQTILNTLYGPNALQLRPTFGPSVYLEPNLAAMTVPLPEFSFKMNDFEPFLHAASIPLEYRTQFHKLAAKLEPFKELIAIKTFRKRLLNFDLGLFRADVQKTLQAAGQDLEMTFWFSLYTMFSNCIFDLFKETEVTSYASISDLIAKMLPAENLHILAEVCVRQFFEPEPQPKGWPIIQPALNLTSNVLALVMPSPKPVKTAITQAGLQKALQFFEEQHKKVIESDSDDNLHRHAELQHAMNIVVIIAKSLSQKPYGPANFETE